MISALAWAWRGNWFCRGYIETKGLSLAPREEHRSEHGFGEPKGLSILPAVNQGEKFGDGPSLWMVQTVNDQTAGLRIHQAPGLGDFVVPRVGGNREACCFPGQRREPAQPSAYFLNLSATEAARIVACAHPPTISPQRNHTKNT